MPEPEPQPQQPQFIPTEDPVVKITQEEYDKTFAEVEAVIQELNNTIKAKNIRKWESYLTPQFRDSVMSPKNLAELNETPLLKRNNISISSLREYFEIVVAPSRANVRLDDLKFTDAQRVQAFMTIVNKDNVPEDILIYQLEKIGNAWKVSYW
ncbi:MAG: hypothetical protein LBT33_11035 [Spirochaetia bacterium]|nr:hypothetical protein [Spirochaetia bacterium]